MDTNADDPILVTEDIACTEEDVTEGTAIAPNITTLKRLTLFQNILNHPKSTSPEPFTQFLRMKNNRLKKLLTPRVAKEEGRIEEGPSSPKTAPPSSLNRLPMCSGDTEEDGQCQSFEDIIAKRLGHSLLHGSRLEQELKFLEKIGYKNNQQIEIPKVTNAPTRVGANNIGDNHSKGLVDNQNEDKLKIDGNYVEKKVLILDLDNTLIQSQSQCLEQKLPSFVRAYSIKRQRNPRIPIGAKTAELYYTKNKDFNFYLRPFTIDFLLNMRKYYKIVVFTAADTRYARAILEKMEELAGSKIFRFFYSRPHLGQLGRGFSIKRLIADVPLTQMLVVDDSFLYWFHCPRNYIPIRPFLGDAADTALINLGAYLQELVRASDIMEYNDRTFNIAQKMEDMFE